MIFAQLAGAARPASASHGLDERPDGVLRTIERDAAGHGDDAAGLLPFGFEEIFVAIDAGCRGDVAVRPRRRQRATPSHDGGANRYGGYCVSHVVLAVAERALAVLPRFAPMNGGQRDEQHVRPSATGAIPRTRVEHAAHLERMTIRGVVIHRRLVGEARQRSADHIRFGGMEIPARRVDPQRPSRRLKTLPRRESERMPEHVADSSGTQLFRRHLEPARLIEARAGGDIAGLMEREDRRIRKPAKRARLRCPVEMAERSGEPLEMMFRPVVVAIHCRELLAHSSLAL